MPEGASVRPAERDAAASHCDHARLQGQGVPYVSSRERSCASVPTGEGAIDREAAMVASNVNWCEAVRSLADGPRPPEV